MVCGPGKLALRRELGGGGLGARGAAQLLGRGFILQAATQSCTGKCFCLIPLEGEKLAGTCLWRGLSREHSRPPPWTLVDLKCTRSSGARTGSLGRL